jgi:general secretion pathway protein G
MGGIVMTNLQHRRDARGFTLMEMLVVLGILAMLLALVVPRILGTQSKADRQAAQIQIKSLTECLKHYKLDMKEFPSTDQGLKALVEKPADLSDDKAGRWEGPYTESKELPKDPWGHEYQYEYPPTHGSSDTASSGSGDSTKATNDYPDIWSFGPDGEDGTDDDIKSWTETKDKDQGAGQDKGSSQSSRSERSPSSGQ